MTNLISVGDEVGERTYDLVWSWRSWMLGVEIDRWQFFTGDTERQRTIRVHLGPLHFTTWRLRAGS